MSILDKTELDDEVVQWFKSRRSKLRFFWKAGRTTLLTFGGALLLTGLLLGALLPI